ncbi:MAG TPA: ABC transporter permease, partial [Vicinamibacterales bacterium]|nr:ABC transporter permease [Vicinamibacterales bacterium]
MPVGRRFLALVRNLCRPAHVDRELDEELDAFVDQAAAEGLQAGLTPVEARRQALAALGSRETIKERVRERRTGHAIDVLLRDLSYGVRLALRSPGFSLLVVGTLAAGLAASTAVFSVVDSVLLRRLPYPDADRVVFVGPTGREGRRHFSPPDYVEFSEFAGSYEAICALQGDEMASLSTGRRPTTVRAQEVSAGFLDAFGVSVQLGRGFQPGDDAPVAFDARADASGSRAPGALLISHHLWQDRFGADAGVIGRLVQLDFQPYQIVGVMLPRFEVLLPDEPDYRTHADVWIPTRMDFRTMPRDAPFLRVIARLRPDVTLAEARAEASSFARRQRDVHPLLRDGGFEIDVRPLARSLTEKQAGSIVALLGASTFLLLIACANLASLFLARALVRRREYVVRLALGSGRGRIVRQMMTEGALTAVGGALLAILIAMRLTRALVASAPASIPRIDDVGPSARVIVFTVVCSLMTTALAALVPAVALARAPESESLQTAGRSLAGGTGPWHRAFVVAEVALTVVLLAGTALLVYSFTRLLNVEPGFRPDRVLTANLYLAEQRYPRYPRADSRVRFVREVTEGASRVPGVETAAMALVVPLGPQDAGHTYASEGMASATRVLPPAKYRPVTPGYFRTVGTRLVEGRDFYWSEVDRYRLVTIVDQRLAERAWPERSAIGKRLRIEVWSTRGGGIHLEPLWTEVIGVAENVRSGSLRASDPETVYLPYSLYPVAELSLLARSGPSPDVSLLFGRLRAAVARVDPEVPVFDPAAMESVVAASLAPERFSLGLVGAFGAMGLVLTLVGVYGVLSHLVSLRLRELGLRMALGAPPTAVRRSVLVAGLEPIGVGVIVGSAASVALGRFAEGLLY